MLSLDTNILFCALNTDAPPHARAVAFLESLQREEDVAICELMLLSLE
jgi:predicted nucleic acid-binding protein